MAKEQQNFSMYAGDSESLEFTVIDASTKLPVNLTGAIVKWVMKKGINGDQIIFKNTSSGITITDAGNGKFTVSLAAGDTALVAPGGYYHATEIIDSLGNISMVSAGSAMIRARGISDGTPTTPATTMTTLEAEIGNLSALTTTDKTSLVNAVNENVGKIGNLSEKVTDIATYDLAAEKQTGEADYTPAMNRILANMANYDTLIVPAGMYDISSEIVFDTLSDVTIICRGMLRANDCSGIRFKNCTRVSGNIRILNNALNWTSEISGVTLEASNYCNLELSYIEQFKYGLVLQSLVSGGTSYNQFSGSLIKNNKHQIYIHVDLGGWVTENKFFGGRYALDGAVKSAQTGSYGAYFKRETTSTWIIDNIRFYSPCFENLHNGVYANCTDSLVDHPRFENVDDNWLQNIWVRSKFHAGYGGIDFTKMHLDPGSVDNIFTGKVGSTDNTFTIDSQYGGFAFRNVLGDNTLLGSLQHLNLLNALKFTDSAAQVQTFNKQFEGSAIPTVGSYRKNSIVWNTTFTTGVPIGWVCTGQGTMGTLSGITASGTSGSSTITVNSTTGLYDGCYVLIAGTNGARVVQNINGNTITLSSTLDATVSNAAVSFSAATWKALPNHV